MNCHRHPLQYYFKLTNIPNGCGRYRNAEGREEMGQTFAVKKSQLEIGNILKMFFSFPESGKVHGTGCKTAVSFISTMARDN